LIEYLRGRGDSGVLQKIVDVLARSAERSAPDRHAPRHSTGERRDRASIKSAEEEEEEKEKAK
jgi:hypothetical protein